MTVRHSILSRRPKAAALVLSLSVLGACAAPEDPNAFANDPYQDWNRQVHDFNKGFDTVLLRPAAYVYDAATPTLVRHLFSNALDTLDTPGYAVNRLLQGDGMGALRAVGRLGVNLLLGLGVLDPATEFGLPAEATDFGLTLASWGAEEGVYIELPFLGPSTTRAAAGRLVDFGLDPVSWARLGIDAPVSAFVAADAVGVVEVRADNFDALDQVLYGSEDSYIAARSAYLQLRRRQEAGGVDVDSVPDIFAE